MAEKQQDHVTRAAANEADRRPSASDELDAK